MENSFMKLKHSMFSAPKSTLLHVIKALEYNKNGTLHPPLEYATNKMLQNHNFFKPIL